MGIINPANSTKSAIPAGAIAMATKKLGASAATILQKALKHYIYNER